MKMSKSKNSTIVLLVVILAAVTAGLIIQVQMF